MRSTTQNALKERFREMIAAFPQGRGKECVFAVDYDAAQELQARVYKTLRSARGSQAAATAEQHALIEFAKSAFGNELGSEPDIYANPAMLSFHHKNALAVLSGKAPRDFLKAFVERGFSSPERCCASVLERVAGIGQEVFIEFDGGNGAGEISLTLNANGNDLNEDLADDIMALAPYLIHLEIPDWKSGAGAEGRLRLIGPGDVFINADDRNNNWLLERDVDLSELGDYLFTSGAIETDDQPTPSIPN